MNNLKPILLALGAKPYMSNLLLPRANWVMNPSVASGNDKTFIKEEIRLALKDEGFNQFLIREEEVWASQIHECLPEGELSVVKQCNGEGSTEFEAWIKLFARYKNIKEDGE